MSEKDHLKESLAAINRADYTAAEEIIGEGLNDSPDNEKLLNLLGWVMFQKEKYEDVVKVYKRLVKINAQLSFTMFYNLGKSYFNLKDYRSAIDALSKTIEQVPGHKNALFYLSAAYENLGDLKSAKKILSKLTETTFTGDEIKGISIQNGLNEYTSGEMAESCQNLQEPDSPAYSRSNFMGTWSIVQDFVIIWDGNFEVEHFIEHSVFNGDGRIVWKGAPVVFVLGKDEEMWINGRFFAGADNVFEFPFNKDNLFKVKGIKKIIFPETPRLVEDISEKACIKKSRLIAVLGSVKLKSNDEIVVVQKGSGKAFLS